MIGALIGDIVGSRFERHNIKTKEFELFDDYCKATLDNGYGMFVNMLGYKLSDRGKRLVKVDRWFPSSQICSCCKSKQHMPLDVRTYECACCGCVIDRDLNAAINILNEGLRIIS